MKNGFEGKKKITQKPQGEKSSIIGLGFCAAGASANTSVVDAKNGKIVRIRPLHFDWKYNKKQFNPWKMETRGKSFEPRMRSLPSAFSLAYKKRVYSPNRILYPLKRVDWDPNGDRNPQNRGKSKYQRISWDEATDIIASELKRIKGKYCPYAVLAQCDGHGETKAVHRAHGCNKDLLNLLGGCTEQFRNADSWEGWMWGARHAWGMDFVGVMEPSTNVMPDICENTELLLFWGCDPEKTPQAFDGQMASRLCYFWREIGIKQIYICPDLNYGAAVHADKWVPIRPGTDAALQLAIAYVWMTEGTYDKEYLKTHSVSYDKFEDYVLGKEDGVPKTPEWASPKCAISEWTIKALARQWASIVTSIAHGNGGPGIRSVYSTENGRLEVLLLAMQGVGKPGVHQVKMIEWWGLANLKQNPMPGGLMYPNIIAGLMGGFFPQGPPKQFIPKNLIHDALLNAPISWYGTTYGLGPIEDQFLKFTYPAKGCSEIRMIWTDTPCWTTCWNDSNSFNDILPDASVGVSQ